MNKIVCLGDSITYGYDSASKMSNYTQVETPYPKHLNELLGDSFEVINSGNVGWQARQTVRHLNSLVFKHRPRKVILMLGINDSRGSRQGFMVSKENYMRNMQEIIDQIQGRGIKVYLLTPTPVNFFRAKKFHAYAIELAKKNNLEYIDLYTKIYDDLTKTDRSLSDILADNVHLSQEYYLKLAEWVNEEFEF